MTDPLQQDDVQLLDEIHAIRIMPGMYIGGTDQRALHHVIWSLLEIAAFEVLANETGCLTILIDQKNVVSVSDNSVGLPIGNPDFAHWWVSSYKSSTYKMKTARARQDQLEIDLFTIKISCALAEYFTIQSKYDGFLWEQHYRHGEAQGQAEQKRQLAYNEPSGTTFIFEPDSTIFKRTDADHDTLTARLRELAYLEPRLTLTFEDRREAGRYPLETYSYPKGLQDFVRYLNRDFIPLHEPVLVQETLILQPKVDQPGYSVIVEAAIQYVDSASSLIISFVNGYETRDGGIHVEEVLDGLEHVILSRSNLPKSANQLETDISIGLTAVVNVWHPSPHFEGATRACLNNEDLDYEISPLISDIFEQFAAQNPAAMQAIVDHYEKEPIARYRRRYGQDANPSMNIDR